MPAGSDRFVSLPGGLIVPAEPLMLVIDLQMRGFQLTPCGDGDLEVRPFSRLSPEDCRQLKRWKLHVREILARYDHEVIQ